MWLETELAITNSNILSRFEVTSIVHCEPEWRRCSVNWQLSIQMPLPLYILIKVTQLQKRLFKLTFLYYY